MKRREVLVRLAGLLVVPLAACGPRAERVVVEMRSDALTPGQVTIGKGGTVVWHNMDSIPHSCTCKPSKGSVGSLPQGASPWDSGWIYTGEIFSRTFDTPGTYVYDSTGQESTALIGTVVVHP